MKVLMVVVTLVTATEQVFNQPYQYYKADGASFVYGYPFPEYLTHGSPFHYVNTYGQPTFLAPPLLGLGAPVQPISSPAVGLRALPVPSVSANVHVEEQQLQQINNEDRMRSSLSPMLKLAVDAGFVRASGSSQSGSSQYEVSEELAKDAGSVSELAYRLGAIPVAAVHDVQMRPNEIIPEESFSPVLHHKSMPQVTRYTLEVPVQ
ncbi:uncharacterized protein LOC127003972 isoform X2 [Eriocheir sinensis]|uniref:uncharacterized protein LOC127003972 isoform X2 n=1 Tax=Eriocheir sinensis TaxID=95602 RepID=UPI0021C6DA55|nr:uncharacterized protein LOC127003972 isoform X2 [Eriocheir sinensis]